MNVYQKKYLKELRNKNNKQAFGNMYKDGAYCAIGLIKKLTGSPLEWSGSTLEWFTEKENDYIRNLNPTRFGIDEIMRMNDVERLSLSVIADKIEEDPARFFKQ